MSTAIWTALSTPVTYASASPPNPIVSLEDTGSALLLCTPGQLIVRTSVSVSVTFSDAITLPGGIFPGFRVEYRSRRPATPYANPPDHVTAGNFVGVNLDHTTTPGTYTTATYTGTSQPWVNNVADPDPDQILAVDDLLQLLLFPGGQGDTTDVTINQITTTMEVLPVVAAPVVFTVVDASSGNPIPGAVVKLGNLAPATTDGSGNATINAPTPTSIYAPIVYSIRVQQPGKAVVFGPASQSIPLNSYNAGLDALHANTYTPFMELGPAASVFPADLIPLQRAGVL